MPLWSTRSSIWRAVSASYALSGKPRSASHSFAPGWAARVRAKIREWSVQHPKAVTTRPTPAPRAVCVDLDPPLPAALQARIDARWEREQAQRKVRGVTLVKRAAVKRNGGLRGSTATRWRR